MFATFRLFPSQNGTPEGTLLRFQMEKSFWGSKTVFDVSLWEDGASGGPGYFQVFPSNYPGGEDTVLRMGLDNSLQGTKRALEVHGPTIFSIDGSLWATRNALEVHGNVVIHNDLTVTHGINNPYGPVGILDDGYVSGNLIIDGNVTVGGVLSKSGGTFVIDHPLDPERKTLSHSFVESPDMMNIYNGNVVTGADNLATVELPAYFQALNRDFRYQLTVVGDQFAQVRVSRKIANNSFVIASDKPGIEVSWQVTGIRKDAWAEAHRVIVEQDKPAK